MASTGRGAEPSFAGRQGPNMRRRVMLLVFENVLVVVLWGIGIWFQTLIYIKVFGVALVFDSGLSRFLIGVHTQPQVLDYFAPWKNSFLGINIEPAGPSRLWFHIGLHDGNWAFALQFPAWSVLLILWVIWYVLLKRSRRQGMLGHVFCPRCGYDLHGSCGSGCPECGHQATTSRTAPPVNGAHRER